MFARLSPYFRVSRVIADKISAKWGHTMKGKSMMNADFDKISTRDSAPSSYHSSESLIAPSTPPHQIIESPGGPHTRSVTRSGFQLRFLGLTAAPSKRKRRVEKEDTSREREGEDSEQSQSEEEVWEDTIEMGEQPDPGEDFENSPVFRTFIDTMQTLGGKLSNVNITGCLNQIPIFDGEGLETVEEFAEKFAEVALAYGLDTVDSIRAFPLRLKGRAKREFDKITPEERTDWKTMIARFKELVNLNTNRQVALASMNDKWKEGDTVTTYADRIKKLVKRLYGEIDANSRKTIMKDLFVKSLPTEMWQRVVRQNPQTFDEAIKMAEIEEGIAARNTGNRVTNQLNAIVEKTDKLVEAMNNLSISNRNSPGRKGNQSFNQSQNRYVNYSNYQGNGRGQWK